MAQDRDLRGGVSQGVWGTLYGPCIVFKAMISDTVSKGSTNEMQAWEKPAVKRRY